ncbi:glutathione peroxidase [Rhodoplanes sp. TEM]|uniref:Glutathione peroxidase n=1 Tax=Rhodoplanes tepidamans TaxID=200616 RepID=A0ABT5JH31_RHOTP|nr:MULTISPECIES: glutathione peroxidase [Rhodoplanes]MDC7788827.1 glutathione peroxidase [Rhodoplanes tepidamans]MDC7987106.1 glutathione peroxidase [Rhodoplanes sp. TEM]MDQ0357501.1 glutathione peroxidase [Rhodoplanes tepidamans]
MPIDRRTLLASLLVAAAAPAGARAAERSRANAWVHAFARPDGDVIRLSGYAGKPILIVNTASLCGYTPQYAGLETLWTRYRERGLLVIGVPSDDFGRQEPGDAASIDHTAHRYGVTFPIAAKTSVRGANAHPFYRWAALERPLDTPRWNFHKYLIDRDGRIAAAFASAVEPLDARLVGGVETMLIT